MPVNFKIPRIIVVGLLLAASLSACGGSTSSTTSLTTSNNLVVRLSGDIDTLDPAKAQQTYSYQVIEALYDRLVSIQDGKVVSYLAQSWTQTADSVSLVMRSGVKCDDGTEMTPSVAAASLRRLGDPKTGAPYSSLVFGSSGYSVTANDSARTLNIHTNKPFSDLLYGLAQPMASIVCPAGLKNPASLQSGGFGTGPYELRAAVRGSSYTLKPRAGYAWGPVPGAQYPKQLTFRVVASESTATNLLLSGGLDIAQLTGANALRLSGNKTFRAVTEPIYGSFYLVFNERPGHPGADPQVRKGLATAIDSQAYNKTAFDGSGTVSTSIFSPSMPCYSKVIDTPVTSGNAPAAKSLLATSGWVTSGGALAKEGKPLSVKIVGTNDTYQPGSEYILSTFKSLGVAATLRVGDINTFAQTLFGTGDWDVAVYPFTPLAQAPSALNLFLSGPPSPKGANYADVQNSAFNQAGTLALSTLGAERCAHWADAQRALVSASDVFPLVTANQQWFVRGGSNIGLIGGGTGFDVHSLTASK